MLRKKLSPSIGKWRRNHVWRLKEEWVAGAMLDLIDRLSPPLKKSRHHQFFFVSNYLVTLQF
jgi:hypothetical protein